MLAACVHLLRGTPYVFQGEELGMTNAGYTSIGQYRDVESLNYYQILLDKGSTKEEALEVLAARSRDNSRTPMQWNDEKYAGFSEAEPWIPVSGAFQKEITVQAQLEDEDSILAFYKKLIAMRKQYPVIAKGEISFKETGSDMALAYERTLGEDNITVLCNLSGKKLDIRADSGWSRQRVLLQNDEGREISFENERYAMEPYEFTVFGNVK